MLLGTVLDIWRLLGTVLDIWRLLDQYAIYIIYAVISHLHCRCISYWHIIIYEVNHMFYTT